MADYVAYFNGEFVPFSQVKIDPLDRGFLVGDCVFDVARTFNGKSFRMREHVDRLYRSLKYVRIDPGLTSDELERISEEVISRNEHLRADVGDQRRRRCERGPGRRHDHLRTTGRAGGPDGPRRVAHRFAHPPAARLRLRRATACHRLGPGAAARRSGSRDGGGS